MCVCRRGRSGDEEDDGDVEESAPSDFARRKMESEKTKRGTEREREKRKRVCAAQR